MGGQGECVGAAVGGAMKGPLLSGLSGFWGRGIASASSHDAWRDSIIASSGPRITADFGGAAPAGCGKPARSAAAVAPCDCQSRERSEKNRPWSESSPKRWSGWPGCGERSCRRAGSHPGRASPDHRLVSAGRAASCPQRPTSTVCRSSPRRPRWRSHVPIQKQKLRIEWRSLPARVAAVFSFCFGDPQSRYYFRTVVVSSSV